MIIQHHPARAALLPPLVQATGARVVADPEPDDKLRSPWRTYARCLSEARGDHLAVIQDDVTVCDHFTEALTTAVEEKPDALIALFLGGQPHEDSIFVRPALERGERWLRLSCRRWVPVVALVWPAHRAKECLVYVEAQSWPANFRADDEIVGHYVRDARVEVWATIPSLVEHPDVVPSITGKKAWGGLDPGRVAAYFDGTPGSFLPLSVMT